MFSKTFLAALFAALAVAQSNSDNPTIAPATGEKVPGCKPYTLKWTPTTSGTVSIEIISGSSQGTLVPVGKVATGIPNSGTFTWTPEAALGANAVTGYKIFDDATGQFQYSVPFSVDGATCKDEPKPEPTPSASKDTYPTEKPTSHSETPVYPTKTPVVSSSSSCTTTSTVYVPPTGTGYPVPPHNGTTGYPVPPAPPATTLYPTGTGAVPKPTPTPPAQEFPGAGSAIRAGLGLVGAAAAAVLML